MPTAQRLAFPAPTCPTTRTGRRGSRPTGSPRSASRSGSGSTRSCSCRCARRPGAVPARARLREAARRDRPRDAQVLGERDRGGRGHRADGRGRDPLPVRRAHAEPEPELRLRPRERGQAPAAHVLELGAFFVTYATIEGFRPTCDDLERGPDVELRPLDRWLLARTQHLVAEVTDAYERFWTPDITGAWERSSTTSRTGTSAARAGASTARRGRVPHVLDALVQATRVIAPVMPFLAEQLWQRLVADVVDGAPDSVFLAGWPEPVEALVDESLVGEIAETRRSSSWAARRGRRAA